MKKTQIKEELNTNLFKKIMDDKVNLISKLKEERDAILATIDSEYEELLKIKKEKKQLNKQIRIKKRAISKSEKERFKLNRQINKQLKLTNKLSVNYSNEEEVVIDSSRYYPEQVKTR